jgi:NAD(P)-dependent dehydrogenase (short-subunit alcohol dehydrogenase family)
VGELDGKVALVTGCAINIGHAIATTLATAGAAVMCNDVDADGAERTAAEIRAAGGAAIAAPGSILDEDAIAAALDAAEAAFGPVNVLVNNAAVTVNKTLLDIALADWQRVIDTVLTGTFLVSRAVAKRMIADGVPGVIVNLGSTTGHRGRAGAIAYATAKGGILNLTASASVPSRRRAPERRRVRASRARRRDRSIPMPAASRSGASGRRRIRPTPCASWSPMRLRSSPVRICVSTAARSRRGDAATASACGR